MPETDRISIEASELQVDPGLQMLWADGAIIMQRENPPMVVFRFVNIMPELKCEVARIAVSRDQAVSFVETLSKALDVYPVRSGDSDSVESASDS